MVRTSMEINILDKARSLNPVSSSDGQGDSVEERVKNVEEEANEEDSNTENVSELSQDVKDQIEEEIRRYGAIMYDTGRAVRDIEQVDRQDDDNDQLPLLNAAMLFIILMIEAKPYLQGFMG